MPSTLLSHSAICAHWAPTHVSMRLVGKSGLCGPNSTVSIMKLLQKKATSPMTSDCHHPSHQMRAQGVDVLEKVISVDSGSFFHVHLFAAAEQV